MKRTEQESPRNGEVSSKMRNERCMTQLGRLKRVDLREVWASEAADFTPWLAQQENLMLLADAIGLELELEAQEKDVGPFRADILCKDTAAENWVLIENQLARTDHTHLGQLITYAAGLRAVTIVWVAHHFSEEHRAAMDWLNGITDSDVNFFGLEVELWQIGGSAVAPKFNIVSKPNDWTRTVSEAASRGELTEAKETQVAFWTAFKEFVSQYDTPVRTTKPRPQHWMAMGIGRSGFQISAVASFWDSVAESFDSHEVRAELVLKDRSANDYFALLEASRESIESELGYPLAWYNPPDKMMCRLYVRRAVEDLQDQEEWSELHDWLLKRIEDFHRVLKPIVLELEVPEEALEGAERSA